MKKIISYILIAVFVASFALFFNSHIRKVKASTDEDIYNEMNTYKVESIEKKRIQIF